MTGENKHPTSPSNRPGPLSTLTISLHWLVAIGIIGLMALGIFMESFERYDLYDIHKSLGSIALIFVIWRMILRLQRGWPAPVTDQSEMMHKLVKGAHWALLFITLMFPLSGVLMSVAGGHGLHVFGWELVAENINPANPEEPVVLWPVVSEVTEFFHSELVYPVIAIIAAHIGGALKHHFWDKDTSLLRMLGKD